MGCWNRRIFRYFFEACIQRKELSKITLYVIYCIVLNISVAFSVKSLKILCWHHLFVCRLSFTSLFPGLWTWHQIQVHSSPRHLARYTNRSEGILHRKFVANVFTAVNIPALPTVFFLNISLYNNRRGSSYIWPLCRIGSYPLFEGQYLFKLQCNLTLSLYDSMPTNNVITWKVCHKLDCCQSRKLLCFYLSEHFGRDKLAILTTTL